MKKILGGVLKAGAILFVVGAALAIAAPVIAMGVGIATPGFSAAAYNAAAAGLGHSANPLWMGAFFGAFGAIDAVVKPAFD